MPQNHILIQSAEGTPMESHPYTKPRGVGPVTTELTPDPEPTAAQPPIANPAFRIKLGILLPVALLLHIVNQRKARVWSQAAETPVLAKVAGLAELLLWLSVAIAAVSIPFV